MNFMMITWITLLGEVGPQINGASGEGSWITTQWIIGALAGVAGIITAYKIGQSKNVHLTPNPLQVRLEEEFVTRREFDSYKHDSLLFRSEIRADVKRMEALFERTMSEIKDMAKVAHAETEEVAKRAYEGRAKIWDKLNDTAERVGGLEAVQGIPSKTTAKKG